MRAWALAAMAIASPAWAQVTPVPSRDDWRVQTVRYAADTPVRIETSPGTDTAVILAPGERIASVAISNNAAYQVTISDARDSFILHTSMVLYQGAPVGKGSIAIKSDLRSYELQLSSAPSTPTPYVLRFTYSGSDRRRAGRSAGEASGYRLSGKQELRPSAIRDDGSKTFIQWRQDRPLPAVFALDRLGREEMVDGYMRDGVFTIDRVHDRLVFRIDDSKAEAQRRKGETRQ